MKKIKILLIDDAIDTQTLINAIFKNYPVKLIAVENGIQAFEKLKSDVSVDLILLDLFMPKMDGFTFLDTIYTKKNLVKVSDSDQSNNVKNDASKQEKIKENGNRFFQKLKNIPIIIITSDDKKENIIKLKPYKIAGYIIKPINKKVIMDKIETTLGITFDKSKSSPSKIEKPEKQLDKSFIPEYNILNQLDVGICIVGSNYKIQWINGKACQLFYSTPKQLIGQPYADFFATYIARKNLKQISRLPLFITLIQGNKLNYTVNILDQNNIKTEIECIISPVKNSNNDIVAAIELYIPKKTHAGGNVNEDIKQYVSKSALRHIARAAKQRITTTALKEHRSITFIDIVGFTTLSEKLDPHETISILNIFYSRVY